MLRAQTVMDKGTWAGAASDRVVLDFDARHRRRIAMQGEAGTRFLLDLEQARALRGGDGLLLSDGRIVEVVALPEPLLEVRAASRHELMRLAWHLGNRHLPTEIHDDRLLIRRDHVIAAMLEGLGASVSETERAFDPEGGAYGGHAHGDHGHRHDHDHDHHHEHEGENGHAHG